MALQGTQQIINNLEAYQQKCLQAVTNIAAYFAPMFEAHAKENAAWTDRSANARQALHGCHEQAANDIVEIYIAHGMDYGVFLELRWAGKYAILWDTVNVHLPQIDKMLKDTFS